MASSNTRKHSASHRWRVLVYSTLAIGATLRIALFGATQPRIAYDNHIEVALYHATHGRLPEPDALWQAYQPPLYHLLGSAVYRVVAGTTITDHRWVAQKLQRNYGLEAAIPFMARADADQTALPDQPELAWPMRRHLAGLKAIQGISLVAGLATLLLVWATLRKVFPESAWAQWIGLMVIAVLPRHIYMSAMATNDSLSYVFITLAIYLLVCYLQRPTWPVCLGWGLAAGLAIVSKGTGLVLLPVGATVLGAEFVRQTIRGRRCGLLVIQTMVMLLLAVGIGALHYSRLAVRYGNPFVINADITPRRNMELQPPGRDGLRFLSVRPLQLWRRPFIHQDTVGSWPTAVYARMWFDYEPWFTQWRHAPMKPFLSQCYARTARPGHTLWTGLLDWPDELAPKALVWQGRLLYLSGLPVALLILLGPITLGRRNLEPAGLTMLTLAVFTLALVIVQAMQRPNFCAFKAAYVLAALVALAAWAGAGAEWLVQRLGRAIAVAVIGPMALASMVHFAYLSTAYANAPSMWSSRAFSGGYERQARAFLAQGNAGQAARASIIAAQIKGSDADSWVRAGQLLQRTDRRQEAAECFRKALAVQPDAVAAYVGLYALHAAQHRFAEAIDTLRTGLRHTPDDPHLLNSLAWTLATCPQTQFRNGPEALRLAQGLVQHGRGNDPPILLTLSAAYAETGQPDQARQTAEHALGLARQADQPKFVELIEKKMQEYRAAIPAPKKAP
ncbi:MAG TPA: tetratricopeptide repeat protein [Phycisphaerae bacterium]|nr:tetratricopeptide repeat protein [Phycisphaerae bacterium]